MYDFGAGSAVAFIVVAHLGGADRRHHPGAALRPLRERLRWQAACNPFLTFLFAGADPALHRRPGRCCRSRQPRARPHPARPRARASSPKGLNFETYRYVFTGELPDGYLAGERQPRDDLGRRAAGAAEPAATSAIIALVVDGAQPAARRAGGLRLRPLRLSRQEAQLHVPDPLARWCRRWRW